MDRVSFMRPIFEMPMLDVHGKVLAKHKLHHRLTRPLINLSKLGRCGLVCLGFLI
jgi:hypothetical protein